ncbi:NUDIX domain-containing protein [Polyplosphaeria fusca]|uniref:NUDIX domain-containing protein n=1 Tax=Polyplosphaeria fusca TaxID=682080 RepID=A0A9P4V155_9PLEO|nr:NUDIX domain-containing protein [Polyplosphaeria fusca]
MAGQVSKLNTRSFYLEEFEPRCRVDIVPENLTPEQLTNFVPFQDWKRSLHHALSLQSRHPDHPFNKHPWRLEAIQVQSVVWFTETRLGFVMLQAVVKNDKEGAMPLPGTVFLRGNSVAVLIILELDNEARDKYVLLAVQPRIAAGSLAFTEIPAGMMDGSGKFNSKAIDEIKEECNLVIRKEDLLDMTGEVLAGSAKKATEQTEVPPGTAQEETEKLREAMYPSVGGCDEAIGLMFCQKKMTQAQMDQLQNAVTGLEAEGETIRLKLVKLEHVWREVARDGKALAALALYGQLRKEGKIKEPTEFVELAESSD